MLALAAWASSSGKQRSWSVRPATVEPGGQGRAPAATDSPELRASGPSSSHDQARGGGGAGARSCQEGVCATGARRRNLVPQFRIGAATWTPALTSAATSGIVGDRPTTLILPAFILPAL